VGAVFAGEWELRTAHITKAYGIPGGGKTTWLLARIAEEIAGGVPVREIADLTFSVAAKEVVKERLDLRERDLLWFRTIHSAAMKATGIGRHDVIGWQHYEEFSKLTGMKITRDDQDIEFAPNSYNICLRAVGLSANMRVPMAKVLEMLPDDPKLARETLQRFAADWAKYKSDRGLFDFTDMLLRYESHGEPLPVRVGLLDEGQDNSPLQWACVEKMFANCERVYMAGDDDQSIYSFIGASEYGFLDHACDEEVVLAKSYRCPVKVGEYADRVIRQLPRRKDKVVEWQDKPGDVYQANLDPVDVNWSTLVDQFPSIMVLARHRSGASKFSRDLELRGVNHDLHGTALNDWPEAGVVHSLFRLRDGKSITPTQAERLADALGIDSRPYRDMGRRERVTKMNDAATVDYMSAFAKSYTARKRYEAINRLILSQGYEALAQAPSISVGTMHGAKGREADLVIILPDCNAIVRRNINAPSEVRLAYVALTRAKKEVQIMLPRSGSFIHHFFS
jgi:superfamily I DNA/RNA helicase